MTTAPPVSEPLVLQRVRDAQRPFVLAALVVATICIVTASAGWARVALDLPTAVVELAAEVVLAVLAVVVVTRMHWWRRVGFGKLAALQDLRLFWVPLFPVLPALPAAVAALNGRDVHNGLADLGLWLAIAASVGFVEEVAFRGLILRALAPRGVLLAAVVSSVLFGLMRAVNLLIAADLGATVIQVGYATAMGFAFAAVALRTGVIWPLVAIHALMGAVGFVAAGGTTTTGVAGTDVLLSAVYAVMFTVYGVLVLRDGRLAPVGPAAATARRPV